MLTWDGRPLLSDSRNVGNHGNLAEDRFPSLVPAADPNLSSRGYDLKRTSTSFPSEG
ncbi:hypothetical protein TNCT_201081, partial [Trichonephila clavata]